VYGLLGRIGTQYLEQPVGLHGSTYKLLQNIHLYKSYADESPNVLSIGGDNMVQRLFYATVHSSMMRAETCSSFGILKHYCNYNELCTFFLVCTVANTVNSIRTNFVWNIVISQQFKAGRRQESMGLLPTNLCRGSC
jgi:hypothetical protein